MEKKTSIIIGIILLLIAVCFVWYACNHPEAFFPWSNRTTFMLYGIYIWLIFKFLLYIPLQQNAGDVNSHSSLVSAVIFLLMAVTFFVMEVTGTKVDIFTIIRGFVVIGGLDIGIENLYHWSKKRKK